MKKELISETNILRLLLNNKKYRTSVMNHISPDMFSDQHVGEIYNAMINYQIAYGSIPVDNIEVVIMNNPWKQEADLIKHKIDLVKCEKDKFSFADIDPFLAETEHWWKDRQMGLVLQDGVSMYKGKSVTDYSKLSNNLKDIDAFTFAQNDWLNVSDNEYLMARYLDEQARVPFYNKAMNDVLGGKGMKKKSLNIIMGGTHMGKTRLMHSLAVDLTRRSKDNNVLYVTLEIDRDEIAFFVDSNIIGMKQEAITDMIRSNPQRYLKLKQDYFNKSGQFIVKEYSTDKARPALIYNLIEDMASKGVKPTTVFVDYVGILTPNAKTNNMYEKGGQSSKELRSISQEFEIPFWSAVQPRREGTKKSVAGGNGAEITDIGESMAIADNCDLFLNIIQTPEMFEQKKQLYYFLKNRHSGKINVNLIGEISDLYKVDIVGLSDKPVSDEQQEKSVSIDTEMSMKFGSDDGSDFDELFNA